MPDDADAFLRAVARTGVRAPPRRVGRGDRVGRFVLGDELGRGGMGVVYAARDDALGRQVAIKLIGCAHDSDTLRQRLMREARAASAIRHPHVATVYEVGEHGGELFLVMERLEGESLRQRMQGGPLAVDEALAIGTAIAHGIAAAHRVDVVHRDLKPENVMFDGDGAIKILDFGLAKWAHPSASSDELITEGDAVLGTPAYMAPEQAAGAAVHPGMDVFSLGAILYEMIAGVRAFDEPTAAATLLAASNREPVPLARHAPDVPPWLAKVVHRMLHKRPDERYADGDDVARALTAGSGAKPRWRYPVALSALGLVSLLVAVWATTPSSREAYLQPTLPRSSLATRAGLAPVSSTASASPSNTAASPSPAPTKSSHKSPPLDPLADQK